jgi:transcriptional regulator with XRE-family HTH domain
MKDSITAFGKLCREYRKKKGLTMAQVAPIIGCKQSNITQVETGKCKPSFGFIIGSITAYGIKPTELLGFFSSALSECEKFEIPLTGDTVASREKLITELAKLLLNKGGAFPAEKDNSTRSYIVVGSPEAENLINRTKQKT